METLVGKCKKDFERRETEIEANVDVNEQCIDELKTADFLICRLVTNSLLN